MGIVFRGTDLELGRGVAIKVLSGIEAVADGRTRLLREARAAAALNHRRIVSVHDVGEDGGVSFFVMELVEGRTLRHSPPRDPAAIVEVACQICEALEHAHSHGLVHRDLKPENVLMTGSSGAPEVKLADLGLATPVSDSEITRTGAIVGTALYLAPEQALGRALDGRADLYALGAVLYELVTGRPPFLGDNPLAIISQHVLAPVVPPRAVQPDVHPGLEGVILRLLSKEPERRYATATDTAAALRRALEGSAEAPAGERSAAAALLDALSRGRLVGRTSELTEARDLWRRALDGRGHGLLLSGEPGVGKTRLARELLVQGALDGALVLTGGCYEYEAATPYLPFVEAFRRWARETSDDGELRIRLGETALPLARIVPEIEARVGPFPARPELPPHEERLLFFDAVVGLVRSLAKGRGLLFYMDDLHWADGGTLWLLGHLLRQLRDERVLLVASYREIELDRAHPLAKALVEWNRERLTTRVILRRLGPEETRAQLAALLGEDVSQEFAGAVHRETEGNPFFVEEVLKALIESGSVRREGGRWTRSEIRELEIPQSMKAAIGHRLDRVSPECNDLLRAAAVMGKTFEFRELIAAAGDRDEELLLDALDEASAAQLIVAGQGESFAFTHDKIREVLYEEMNPIRRRRLHRRTAEGLERLRDRLAVASETLAHHYIEAGEHERGLEFARQAAAAAQKVFAYDEAIVALGRALECAESLGLPGERAELEEAIGNAYVLRGDLVPACEHFERALALTEEPERRARLQCRAASSLVSNGDPRGLEYLRSALEVLDPEKDPVTVALALALQGRFHHLAGRHRPAIELMLRAAALSAPPPDADTLPGDQVVALSRIYAYLAGAHQHLGLFEDADVWARRSIELGRRYGDPQAEAIGYEFLGEDAACKGEWEQGLVWAEHEQEIAGRIHSRERSAWTHFYAGLCAARLGSFERAEQELRQGIELGAAIGERRVVTLLTAQLAVVQAEAGRLNEAMETAERAQEFADALGLFHLRTDARGSLAHVRFLRGEIEDALRLIEEIHGLIGATESRIAPLTIGPLHIEVLFAAGRGDEARERLRVWSELVAECQSPFFAREVERLRALVG